MQSNHLRSSHRKARSYGQPMHLCCGSAGLRLVTGKGPLPIRRTRSKLSLAWETLACCLGIRTLDPTAVSKKRHRPMIDAATQIRSSLAVHIVYLKNQLENGSVVRRRAVTCQQDAGQLPSAQSDDHLWGDLLGPGSHSVELLVGQARLRT